MLNKSESRTLQKDEIAFLSNQQDAERIKAIDRIYDSSTDKLQFLRYFNRQGALLSIQRSKEAAQTQTLQKLYGINQ